MIVIDFVRQTIPGGWRQTPSGWVSGNCPMCATRGHKADTRHRGGFMFADDKVQYNCFNCGFKTGWAPGRKIGSRLQELLLKFGADPAQIQRVNFELLKQQEEENIVQQFIRKEESKHVYVKWTPVALPPNSKRLSDVDTNSLTPEDFEHFVKAVEYVHSRNLDFYGQWYWTNCNEKPYKNFANRIILPFYHKGDIVGFTARWVGDTPNKETPKYYLQSPSNFVYNLDAQTNHKYVIVTEGQLDALLVSGVAMNGNTPSETQADIVDQLEKDVILLPDADKPGMEMVKTAIRRGWSVSFPPWEHCKDASDAVEKYGRLFTVRSILSSVESNPTKIKILAKQYCK